MGLLDPPFIQKGGTVLGEAETDVAVTTTSALADIPGLVVYEVTGKRPVAVMFEGLFQSSLAGHGAIVQLLEDGVVIDTATPTNATGGVGTQVLFNQHRKPVPGRHLWKVRFVRFTSGTAGTVDGVTATLRVVEE